MKEQERHNLEFKQSWNEDCLKWICGFANAKGGRIIIGKNDKGEVVGVSHHKKLMDDIPNMVKNILGITAEVNLIHESDNPYIEIVIHPSTVAISFHGRYYNRSGSTNQELTGTVLNDFLLKKSGKTWDNMIEPRAGLEDISEDAVRVLLKTGEKEGRLSDTTGLTLTQALEKLRLTEDGRIKRAAVVLFGKDPGKFYPNIFIKIGRFGDDDADLRFHETVEGNLVTLIQKVLDQLDYKFLIRIVSYDGIRRVEKWEYPFPAIREMLLNAIIHRNYTGAPTQIRVYDDKISVWNEGKLPEELTPEALKRIHPSIPRNPVIASVAFKGAYIEAWGRGIMRIIESCTNQGLPEPMIEERDGGLYMVLFKNKFSDEYLNRIGLNKRQLDAISFVKKNGKISNAEYQRLFIVSKATATRDLTELVEKFRLFRKVGETGVGTIYELNIGYDK